MNCHKVQSLISAYVDCELSGHEMLAIRQHLSECPECNAEFQSLFQVKRALGRLNSKHPHPDLAERICRRLDLVKRPIPWHKQVFQNVQDYVHSIHPRFGWAAVCLGLLAVSMVFRGGLMPAPSPYSTSPAFVVPSSVASSSLNSLFLTSQLISTSSSLAMTHITDTSSERNNWLVSTSSQQAPLDGLVLIDFQ